MNKKQFEPCEICGKHCYGKCRKPKIKTIK